MWDVLELTYRSPCFKFSDARHVVIDYRDAFFNNDNRVRVNYEIKIHVTILGIFIEFFLEHYLLSFFFVFLFVIFL